MSLSGSIPILTVDGLTATGKGTVAAEVARVLQFHCLDSGALYRLVALIALRRTVAEHEVDVLVRISRQLTPLFENGRVFLMGAAISDKEDVTDLLRSEAVGMMASKIAVHCEVREALLVRQRAFAQLPGLVADGRDMGTVVFPNAQLKIFLQAAASVRAQRRFLQLERLGFSATIEGLLFELEARDYRDQHRAIAPTVPALDAVVLDCSELSVADVVECIVSLWHSRVSTNV
jgi:cytidylate kinase